MGEGIIYSLCSNMESHIKYLSCFIVSRESSLTEKNPMKTIITNKDKLLRVGCYYAQKLSHRTYTFSKNADHQSIGCF